LGRLCLRSDRNRSRAATVLGRARLPPSCIQFCVRNEKMKKLSRSFAFPRQLAWVEPQGSPQRMRCGGRSGGGEAPTPATPTFSEEFISRLKSNDARQFFWTGLLHHHGG
jgi:hypothetical protein